MKKITSGFMFAAAVGVLSLMLTSGSTYAGEDDKAFTPDANTVALWNFNEGDGAVIHDSGPLGIDLGFVHRQGEPESNPPKWVKGKFGSALLFNGENKWSCANQVWKKYLGLKDEVTFEAWIKPDEPPAGINSMGLFQNMEYTKSGFRLGVSANGKISFMIEDGKREFGMNSNKPVPLNEWSHIAATYDGKVMKIFINGVEDSQKPLGGGILQTKSEGFCVGYTGGTPYYCGAVGGIRISNVAKKEFNLK